MEYHRCKIEAMCLKNNCTLKVAQVPEELAFSGTHWEGMPMIFQLQLSLSPSHHRFRLPSTAFTMSQAPPRQDTFPGVELAGGRKLQLVFKVT